MRNQLEPEHNPEITSRKNQDLCCIIPPYITERLANSKHPQVRSRAIANLAAAASFRAYREFSQEIPTLMAARSPQGGKYRLVYDSRETDRLPGFLARSEGERKVSDPAVNEAYGGAGDTYDFYHQLFERNSLDDNGMTLISSVHLAQVDFEGNFVPMDNAFWNGEQMAYGDGDGVIFQRFTKSLEVIGHELTHGVQSFSSNLNYRGESGALNEHFADVFGILVRQWKEKEKVQRAEWVIGADVLVPAATRRGIRDMEHPGKAFIKDPDLGTDPQPAHISKIYRGPADRGGVHINSGIPNRAFVLTAKALKGYAWEVAGRIWYDTLLQLHKSAQIIDCAKLTEHNAQRYGSTAKKAVKAAWMKVGISL